MKPRADFPKYACFTNCTMALISLVMKGYILTPSYRKVKPGAKLRRDS